VVVVMGAGVTLVVGSAVVVVLTLVPLGSVETGIGSDVVLLSGAPPAAHADTSMAKAMLQIPIRLIEVLSSVVG
jgi:hypothetical protein